MPLPLNLHFQEFGQGKPLIILHGLFGSTSNWRGVAKTLGETYRVYVLDARNHGESPWSGAMTYEAMADDLCHFIEHHNLDNASVIGHSMGGKTAMVAALHFPGLIDQLAILDIAPVVYDHSHSHFIEAMQNIDFANVKNRSDTDNALKTNIPETGLRQFLLQNLVYNDGSYAWRINLDVLHKAMEDLIGFPELENETTFAKETLFLHGGLSDYVSPASHESIQQLFPKAKFETIENAGHWLHAEQPARVIDSLKNFLN